MTDDAFWNHFVEMHWERQPLHLGTSIEPLLSSHELFSLVVIVAERLGEGESRIEVPWCGDGKSVRTLPAQPASAALLPQRRDRDLDGYRERMSSHDTFFFQLRSLQRFSSPLWPRLVRICRALYERTGVPGHMAWTDAYFGRYASTPFGVHVDGASNFTFGITGYKTLYLWEPDYYHAHMAAAGIHDYERFVGDAIELTVGPGEVIYWPSRYYHIAVPDNRFSATMNLAFYPESRHASWLTRAFDRTIAGTHSKQGPMHGLGLPAGLRTVYTSALNEIREGALERNLLQGFIEHYTRLGFREPPPPRLPTTFNPGDHVLQTRDTVLVCLPDGHGSSIVSANGYAAVIPENDGASGLVRALNGGRRVEVEGRTRDIVEQLYQWGAVERYWS